MAKHRTSLLLSSDDHTFLLNFTRKGLHPAREIKRAMILLDSTDPTLDNPTIAHRQGVSCATVENVQRRYRQEGLERALQEAPRSGQPKKITQREEAYLTAIACSQPPLGQARWTMQMIADRVVELRYLEAISAESVRLVLKKNVLKPWQYKRWCIGTLNGDYLARLEDVLDLYEAAPERGRPRLCFDERPCQLIGQIVAPLPMQPGRVKREDNEYQRNGTAVVLLAYDLDRGRRYLDVRKHRKKADYADFMYHLITQHYADVQQVRLVQDNLNTHSYGSFYEHLEVQKAHWLKNRLEFHFTPKHGSWLNMAELELSALSRQCLDRRIEREEVLAQEVRAWEQARNERGGKLSWTFTTTQARQTLKRHYDNLQPKN